MGSASRWPSELVADGERSAPTFKDSLRGIRAADARAAPFAALKAELEHLRFGTSDDAAAALAAAAMEAAVVALRTDASAAARAMTATDRRSIEAAITTLRGDLEASEERAIETKTLIARLRVYVSMGDAVQPSADLQEVS